MNELTQVVTTERRTYVGQAGALPGYIPGQCYTLTYQGQANGLVLVRIRAAKDPQVQLLEVTWAQFERWWAK